MTPREYADQEVQRVVANLLVLIVAERYQQAKLGDFPASTVVACGRALDAGRGVFAYGQRGRGKTYLAVAVVREYMLRHALDDLRNCWQQRQANGWLGQETQEEAERYVQLATSYARRVQHGVVFKTAVEIMDDIRAVFDGDGRRKTEVVDGYAKAKFLVVDDVGMDKSSEFVRETFDSIVNQRWNDNLLTVFTSNLDFTELDSHYKDRGRMTSRITGMCDVVELLGDDKRLCVAEERTPP